MMIPDSVAVSILRGGTSRGVFFREADLPEEPGDRQEAILRVFGAGVGGIVGGLGGENPVLRKVAIVEPGQPVGGLPVLNCTFGQVNAELTHVDHSLECGNIASAVPLFGALSNWCPTPTTGSQVLVKLANTGRCIRGEWLAGDRSGGTLRLWLQSPASEGRRGVLVSGEPTSTLESGQWGTVRCTAIKAFNTHLFIDGRDVSMPDPLVSRGLSAETLDGLSELVHAVLERSGCSGPLKVSIVGSSPDGGLKARTVFPLERRDHPSVAVTGAAALGIAACIEGSVVWEALGGDPDAELTIAHLSGRVALALRKGPDGLPSEVGLERSCRLVLTGQASLAASGVAVRS